jgi:hypothetical protein
MVVYPYTADSILKPIYYTHSKGKAPSMLSLQNGPMTFVVAKNRSKCNRCDGAILGGQRCGEMKISKNGFTSPRRLCLQCSKEVIEATKADVGRIEQELG